MPPAHMHPPAMPCAKRAASSSTMCSANAKPRLATASTTRPTSSVCLTPQRTASQADGNAPTNIPAGYAAVSRPAPALVMPCSST